MKATETILQTIELIKTFTARRWVFDAERIETRAVDGVSFSIEAMGAGIFIFSKNTFSET